MARIDIKSSSTGGGGGSGTVTSVAVSSTTLTVTGSPITSSGTITANIPDGYLKVGTGATSTLQNVVDTNGTSTVLLLSTVAVTNYGAGAVTSNTAFGASALTSNTTGADNTAFGNLALNANLTGQWNTGVGHEALSLTTGSNNTAVGRHAAKFNTTGAGNTAIGTQAGSVNATGTGNTAVGYIALQNNTNSNNTAVGYRSLNATVGGNQNSGVGVDSLLNNTSGIANTAIGYATGGGITTGNYNTILGANVTGLAAGLSNNIILADGQGNQRLSLGSTGQLKLSQYTATTSFPGTTAGFLAFDASGNILSVAAPSGGSPSGVAGSVQFTDGTNFASNATNFFWDNTNVRLGIGTNAPTARLQAKGSGSTSATTALLVQNSGGFSSLQVTDDNVVKGFDSASSVRFQLGNVTNGQGISTRNGNFAVGFIDSGQLNCLRLLVTGSGFSYIDGYSEGTAKVDNYPLIIGSRVNNNGSSVTNSTTQENGMQTIFGYAVNQASAQVIVNSTTRGFLPPRMTTAQKNAIATPAAGLMVYDTDLNKLCVRTAAAWETITSI
jgi:hypothetical protein